MMRKNIFLLSTMILLMTGCNAVVSMQGKVAGISSGKFLYQDGNLVSEYSADIDDVWKACEKTVLDLKATDVQKDRGIATGVIKAVIQEERVTIKVEYAKKNLTSVSVFVGTVGNNMASRLIHDRIINNLANH
jgi:hypothetical protein